jgi:hypothetical protein
MNLPDHFATYVPYDQALNLETHIRCALPLL